MDSDSDNDSIDQLEAFRRANVKPGMFVSGWEDPNDEIIEDKDPHCEYFSIPNSSREMLIICIN